MKKTLAILPLVFISTFALALEIDPFKGPKPIAVLIQTDPWLMVIGSDTPTVAIYDNGQVVYEKRQKSKSPHLVHSQLSPKALVEIKKRLSTFGDYSTLKHDYNLAPNVTDQPETLIYLSLDGREFVTRVYGLMMPDTKLPTYTVFQNKEKPDELPKAIKDLHKYLTSLDFADAKPWEYDYAIDKSIYWPKNWPDLNSPNTLKRGDSFSIFLPGKELPKLRDFLKTREEKGAVKINGKKWAVSFRFTFPSEPVWHKAFFFQSQPEKKKPTQDRDKSDPN